MKILQVDHLSGAVHEDTADSFNHLPHTNHKDGKYRLRRYSVIELRTSFWDAKEEAVIELMSHREFTQSEDYNKHQGGEVRNFEDIENSVLQSDGMKEICLAFKHANDLTDGQEIEIHQMRVVTQEDGTAKASPEGVHQDGFDYIAMVGVNRTDVEGGELLLHENKKSDPFMRYVLKDGEMITLMDNKLWHNASPLRSETRGHADWFILCANK